MLLLFWFFALLSFTTLNATRLPHDNADTTIVFTIEGSSDANSVTALASQRDSNVLESTAHLGIRIESKSELPEVHALDDIKVHCFRTRYQHASAVVQRLARKFSQLVGYVGRVLIRNALHFSWFRLFVFLFLFRYVRLVVHVIAYNRFKPAPVQKNPKFTARDVTVIIPTVEPRGDAFEECIRRVLANGPASILIVTVGDDNIHDATEHCKALPLGPSTIRVLSVPAPSKREQVKRAVAEIQTPITVLCDDTVFWPPTFLPHVLAPFESDRIGIVGTCKRVRRAPAGAFGLADFWNLCGVMRLERTNFDLASTNAVDGGVSCVSGRTCAVRSSILQDAGFLRQYTAEYIFWGAIGPLNAGDDKWVTRWVMKHGWGVFHQNCPEVRVETILGVKGGGTRFRGQCLRWARSSARDNPKMIVRDGLWRRYPWTAYAVLATSVVNFAALYDPLLVYALHKALPLSDGANSSLQLRLPLLLLVLWILATKFVRPASHYWRHPRDLVYAPFIVMFGYYHSWIKLHALVTCWDISWGTRAGIDAAAAAAVVEAPTVEPEA
ncbi:putative capsule polysaccharide synthase [Diplodia seriata]|uniref:Putative capsule polysaccharide synthase n=1 Tax=Diplodia seriata TaxID=420778 RepID=A0A0G2EBK5_9PEZI|nr:putative capsule polysaccharide synthase [Diplodia seriata]